MINYDSNTLINMSDHRPVFAQFVLMVNTQNESDYENQEDSTNRNEREVKIK